MLLAGCLTSIILIVVGTILDRRERAERDRYWDDYWAKHGGRPRR